MRVDGVLFDLDDTLIDWWTSIHVAMNAVADPHIVDALAAYCCDNLWLIAPDGDHVWHRNTWAMQFHADRHWPAALPDLSRDDIDLLIKRFEEELWVGFFPDTVPTLDRLVDVVPMAVLSNNHLVESEAERLRLHDWFEQCTAAPVGSQKPHPDAFLPVCERLGWAPERTVYVGDSIKSDVLGSLGAGLIPVWHDIFADPWKPPPGVHRIRTLAELPAVLGL